jgi:hypothetical protein
LKPVNNPAWRIWCLTVLALLLVFWNPVIRASAAQSNGLRIQPSRIELLGKDEPQGLLIGATGEGMRDITREVHFFSSNPRVLEVDTNGMVSAVGDGTGEVVVEYRGLSNRVPVTVQGVGKGRIPSFRQEIEPIMTRLGCNQGACHGKLAGQNGFKLSLRGYAPELDHRWMTEDVGCRRVNFAFPENSLLITKPLGLVAHEGLTRFREGSRYHDVLLRWIANRAPGPLPVEQEPDCVAVEILPGDRTLHSGETQHLRVRARWPNGQTRDVTWLAQFFSNDEATVKVTGDGFATALRSGETSIRAHFQGRVGVVRFTIPFTNHVEEWKYTRSDNPIDTAVFRKLQALRLPPSPRCDDSTFLRRAMLDTLGTLPTPEEARAFALDQRPGKRERLIASLFERPEFVDFWTLQLADLLQNRKERDHDVRGKKGVQSFHLWLRGEVAANRPWNQLVEKILTAQGNVVENPAVGYFVTLVGEKDPAESEVTDSVAQAFLGARIGCARCHNHPLEKYTQDDFYHFAAFFSRLHIDRKEPASGLTTLEPISRETWERRRQLRESVEKLQASEKTLLGETSATGKVLEDFNQQRETYARLKREVGELERRLPVARQPRTQQEMVAQGLDRSAISWQPGDEPRQRLAVWLTSTNNEAFAAAMVNRIWRHFLGVGLIEPVDDIRASNPPSNPELLAVLREGFVGGGYDLRKLMAAILRSRTYQLASSSFPGNETDHRFYSHYYARRLPAEVLADAVSAVTGVPDSFDGMPVGIRAIQLQQPGISSYFLSLFGRSERVTACACERMGEVTLPQLLNLQNGEEMAKKIRDESGRLQKRLKESSVTDDIISDLYLSALGRPPTVRELTVIKKGIGDEKPEKAMPDVFWALLNTKEFAFNH